MQVGVTGPTVGAKFSGTRNRPEVPFQVPAHRIVGRYEPAHARIAAGRPDDDRSIDHKRGTGCTVMLCLVRILNFPSQIARARVETKQVSVVSFHVDEVLPHRNPATLVSGGIIQQPGAHFAVVMPETSSGPSV